MNPFTVAFDLQRVLYSILAFIVWTALSVGSGYAWHWHKASLEAAEQTGKQEVIVQTVTTAVNSNDKQTIARLQSTLADTKTRAAALDQLIKDAAHANPSAPVCALPVGLRDAINANLSTR